MERDITLQHVTITDPILVLGFKDTFLLQIPALLGQSNKTR